jgi:hypothetical protein
VIEQAQRMRQLLLCLLVAAALGATAVVPSGALGASTATGGTGTASGGTGTSAGGTNLLESGGTGSSSAAGGAEEEGGEEGTEASKKTATGTSSSEESSGFGSLPIIFGMGGAAVLIAAIAVFILRDARRNAPVPEGALDASTRMSAAQIRKRRAKAKAVKQQRKRNRPR